MDEEIRGGSAKQDLKRSLQNFRRALEELESNLLEFEESLYEEQAPERPQSHRDLELLSIAELCQELGMGKSWVYRRIKNGEIPSVKLGRTVKVKRDDLVEYLERRRYRPPSEA